MTRNFEAEAREILADPPCPRWDRLFDEDKEMRNAAQAYLDNLEDGHDEPEQLIAAIEEYEYRDVHGGDGDDCDNHSGDDYYDMRRDDAAIRSTYGMGAMA